MAIEKQRVHFTRDSVTASSLPSPGVTTSTKLLATGLSLWKKRCVASHTRSRGRSTNRKIDNRTSDLTEAHYRREPPIDHAIRVVALVSAKRATGSRPHDSIDGAIIVASTSEPALQLRN
jgi:hypothetical protein